MTIGTFCRCGQDCPPGKTLCQRCAPAAKKPRKGRSSRWDKLSRQVRRQRPLCERCKQQGRITAATEVHHKRSVERHPELEYDPNNLLALCHYCHQEIEGRQFGLNRGNKRAMREDARGGVLK